MRDDKAPLIKHLEDLRRCLLISLFAIIAASMFCYCYIERLLLLFTKFFDRLIFITPQEAFIVYVKIALFAGLLAASPVIVFQVWTFVKSALTDVEKKYLVVYGVLSLVLFLTGLIFCYYIILPIAINFLLSFQTEKIVPMITFSNAVSFSIALLLGFGLVFELPLAIAFLTQTGLVTPLFLRKKRRHVIVAIFIVSAILTPPDAMTQILLAIPLMALYEMSIIFSRLVSAKNKLEG